MIYHNIHNKHIIYVEVASNNSTDSSNSPNGPSPPQSIPAVNNGCDYNIIDDNIINNRLFVSQSVLQTTIGQSSTNTFDKLALPFLERYK